MFLTTVFTLLQGAAWAYRRLFVKAPAPILGWWVHTETVVDVREPIADLQLQYNFRPITSLSRSTIAVWYSGKTAIRPQDVATTEPLRLVVGSGNRFISARRVSHSSDASDLEVAVVRGDPRTLPLRFNHLENGDGAVFELAHSGDISLAGVVVDVRTRGWEARGFNLDLDYRRWARKAKGRRRYRYRRYFNQFAFLAGLAAVISPTIAIAVGRANGVPYLDGVSPAEVFSGMDPFWGNVAVFALIFFLASMVLAFVVNPTQSVHAPLTIFSIEDGEGGDVLADRE
ncbi:MAG TPA: hypothetical protein VGM94_11805 [Galbitalea sp.]